MPLSTQSLNETAEYSADIKEAARILNKSLAETLAAFNDTNKLSYVNGNRRFTEREFANVMRVLHESSRRNDRLYDAISGFVRSPNGGNNEQGDEENPAYNFRNKWSDLGEETSFSFLNPLRWKLVADGIKTIFKTPVQQNIPKPESTDEQLEQPREESQQNDRPVVIQPEATPNNVVMPYPVATGADTENRMEMGLMYEKHAQRMQDIAADVHNIATLLVYFRGNANKRNENDADYVMGEDGKVSASSSLLESLGGAAAMGAVAKLGKKILGKFKLPTIVPNTLKPNVGAPTHGSARGASTTQRNASSSIQRGAPVKQTPVLTTRQDTKAQPHQTRPEAQTKTGTSLPPQAKPVLEPRVLTTQKPVPPLQPTTEIRPIQKPTPSQQVKPVLVRETPVLSTQADVLPEKQPVSPTSPTKPMSATAPSRVGGVKNALKTGGKLLGKIKALPAVATLLSLGAAAIDYNDASSEIEAAQARGGITTEEADRLKIKAGTKVAGTAGATAIGTAIGGAIGSIIPGAGTFLGASLGGMVAGWAAESETVQKLMGDVGDIFADFKAKFNKPQELDAVVVDKPNHNIGINRTDNNTNAINNTDHKNKVENEGVIESVSNNNNINIKNVGSDSLAIKRDITAEQTRINDMIADAQRQGFTMNAPNYQNNNTTNVATSVVNNNKFETGNSKIVASDSENSFSGLNKFLYSGTLSTIW